MSKSKDYNELIDYLRKTAVNTTDKVASEIRTFIDNYDVSKTKRRKTLKNIGQILGIALLNLITGIITYLLG